MNDRNLVLHELFAKARRALDEGDSTCDFEPSFAELLDFIQANPECRTEALSWFLERLEGSDGSGLWGELLEYCMHELRWPEVEAVALEILRETDDWRLRSVLLHVVAAFEEDWPDADMYERWQGGKRA